MDTGTTKIDEQLEAAVKNWAELPATVNISTAIEAVVCVLSQRLSAGESSDVLTLLSRPLQRYLARCVYHRQEDAPAFGEDEFVKRVSEHLEVSEETARLATRAVFAGLHEAMPEENVRHVRSQLPPDLDQLWASAIGEVQTPPQSAGPDASRVQTVPPSPVDIHDPFLRAVASSGALIPGESREEVLTAILCPLARRLNDAGAQDLLASAPDEVQRRVHACDVHGAPDAQEDRRFVEEVAEHLEMTEDRAEALTRSVLARVADYVPRDKLQAAADRLPADLRALMPQKYLDASAR